MEALFLQKETSSGEKTGKTGDASQVFAWRGVSVLLFVVGMPRLARVVIPGCPGDSCCAAKRCFAEQCQADRAGSEGACDG